MALMGARAMVQKKTGRRNSDRSVNSINKHSPQFAILNFNSIVHVRYLNPKIYRVILSLEVPKLLSIKNYVIEIMT